MTSPAEREKTELEPPPMDHAVAPGELVAVTGANGFIAGWAIFELLRRGYAVRCTVRPRTMQTGFEKSALIPPGVDGEKLEVFPIELESPAEEWERCFTGVNAVIHLASPTKLDVVDPQNQMVEPAVVGIRRVMEAIVKRRNAGDTIKRMVLTSSVVALSQDFVEWRTHVYTSEDMNEASTKESYPYAYAKVAVEKFAREFAEKHEIPLVILCPYTTLGPRLTSQMNENVNTLVAKPLQGKIPAYVACVVGLTDVRDVAAAHVGALTSPLSSPPLTRRYLVVGYSLTNPEYFEIMSRAVLRPKMRSALPYGFVLPNWLVVAGAKMPGSGVGPGTRRVLSHYLGKFPKFDVEPSKRDLGVVYRPPTETLHDTMEWLERHKYI